jgi:hypothetical protein
MIKRAVEESTRTLVSPDGWKLCLRDKDLNELYNLKDDPWETRNLYSERQYASVISRLASEIHRWQESANDKLDLSGGGREGLQRNQPEHRAPT